MTWDDASPRDYEKATIVFIKGVAICSNPDNPIAYTSYIGYLSVHMLYDKSIKFVLIKHHETFGCKLDVLKEDSLSMFDILAPNIEEFEGNDCIFWHN